MMTGTHVSEHTTLRDVGTILFRQRWKIVVVTLTVLLGTAAGTFLHPKVYLSEAKLFFRLGSESFSADPTLAPRIAPVVSVGQAREAELRTATEILGSRELAEQLVDKAGIETVTGRAPTPLPADGEAQPQKRQRERAVTLFLRHLQVEVDKQSNVVTLGLEHPSSRQAQALLSDYVRLFLDRHMEINLGTPSLELFQQQAAQFEREAEKALNELSTLRKEVGSGNTKDAQFVLMQQVNQLRLTVARTRAEQLAAAKKADEFDRTCKTLEVEIVARRRTGISNPVADKIRGNLFDLQVQAQQVDKTYRQDSPPAATLRAQIETARGLLAQEPPERAESTLESNPVRQALLTRYLEEKALAEALAAKLQAEEEALEQENRRLTRLLEQEPLIERAEDRLKRMQANHLKYADMTEQVRISNELVRSKITNVVVLQGATEPLLPVRPKKVLNLILGLIGGLLCGLALALLVEFFDDSLRGPEDVAETLGLRVLASLPEVPGKGAATAQAFLPAALCQGLAGRPLPPALASPLRRLADSLVLDAAKREGSLSLMVSACTAGEGVSTVALNLAAALAQAGHGRVLLVDANLVAPCLHTRLGTGATPGLLDLCHGRCTAADGIVHTAIPELDFLPAGDLTQAHQSPVRLLSDPAVLSALGAWRRSYQFVVLDTPPLVGPVEVACFARLADSALLTVAAEVTRRPVALHGQQMLSAAGIAVAGVLVNRRRFHIPVWLYRRL